ncbi:MAG TPA: trypsin-like peptidase domain-containing protein [Acidimicrobiales bacterium]|nr:trypsin-like peptidase domain-containing protein [Acidimicrobiales bacterium]
MESDDATGDEEEHSPLLPPDDRLWRHPSEVVEHGFPPDMRRRRRRPVSRWVVAVTAGAAGAILAVGLLAVTGNLRHILRVPVVERVALPTGTLTSAGGPSPRVAEIARRLSPAVVALEVKVEGSSRRRDGAGVVFRSDGHVLTSQDAIAGATDIEVVMSDGHRVGGRVVGVDETADVAVVKLAGSVSEPVAPIGSGVRLAVGQDVMALGPAAAKKETPVTLGVVGALGGQVEREGAPTLVDLIETTVPATAALPGAPLVDGSGAVVGITTGVSIEGGDGVGFAVPIEWARAVADQLVDTGQVVRAWMGVEGNDGQAAGGAVITLVRDASPAGAAGLAADDVITAVDGTPVQSMGALRILLRARRPGEAVRLTVRRGKATRTVVVHLAERPAQN